MHRVRQTYSEQCIHKLRILCIKLSHLNYWMVWCRSEKYGLLVFVCMKVCIRNTYAAERARSIRCDCNFFVVFFAGYFVPFFLYFPFPFLRFFLYLNIFFTFFLRSVWKLSTVEWNVMCLRPQTMTKKYILLHHILMDERSWMMVQPLPPLAVVTALNVSVTAINS